MGSKIIAYLGLFLAMAVLMIPSAVASAQLWPDDPTSAAGGYPSTIGYGSYGGYPGGGYGGYPRHGGYPGGGYGSGYGGYPRYGGYPGGGYGGYRGGYP